MPHKRTSRARHANRIMIGVLYPNDDRAMKPRFFVREAEAREAIREGFADDRGLPINQVRLTFKRPIGLRGASCKVTEATMRAFVDGEPYAAAIVGAWGSGLEAA